MMMGAGEDDGMNRLDRQLGFYRIYLRAVVGVTTCCITVDITGYAYANAFVCQIWAMPIVLL